MSRQLYLHFADAQQRACLCGECSTCKMNARRTRYRLRKFMGLAGVKANKPVQVLPVKSDPDGELERRLVEKFRAQGWD